MAFIEIPLTSLTTEFDLIVPLDGEEYVLRFVWNSREEIWYLDIEDIEESVLLGGLRLATDSVINAHAVSGPPGALQCVSTDAKDRSDPGLEDLGQRVRLYYEEIDDIATV